VILFGDKKRILHVKTRAVLFTTNLL
jgi:hypothetical protein